MKDMAMLINERKRKVESIQKAAEWQNTVDDWQVRGRSLHQHLQLAMYGVNLSRCIMHILEVVFNQ